jgi:hypothetical protein
MSLLYKDQKDIIYSVDVKTFPDGKVKLHFSCDGGKHGTDETVDEYELTVLELLKILQANSEAEQAEHEHNYNMQEMEREKMQSSYYYDEAGNCDGFPR